MISNGTFCLLSKRLAPGLFSSRGFFTRRYNPVPVAKSIKTASGRGPIDYSLQGKGCSANELRGSLTYVSHLLAKLNSHCPTNQLTHTTEILRTLSDRLFSELGNMSKGEVTDGSDKTDVEQIANKLLYDCWNDMKLIVMNNVDSEGNLSTAEKEQNRYQEKLKPLFLDLHQCFSEMSSESKALFFHRIEKMDAEFKNHLSDLIESLEIYRENNTDLAEASVFICHAWENDSFLCKRIADILEKGFRFTVYFDLNRVRDITDLVQYGKQIQTSGRVLVLITKTLVEKRKLYLEKEKEKGCPLDREDDGFSYSGYEISLIEERIKRDGGHEFLDCVVLDNMDARYLPEPFVHWTTIDRTTFNPLERYDVFFNLLLKLFEYQVKHLGYPEKWLTTLETEIRRFKQVQKNLDQLTLIELQEISEGNNPSLPKQNASDLDISPNKALFEAAQKGDLGKVKDLMCKGGDLHAPNGVSPNNLSAFGVMCYYGHKHLVEYVLSKSAREANQPIQKHVIDSVLHTTIQGSTEHPDGNHYYVVQQLISQGADVNGENSFGLSPLQMVTAIGDIRMLKLLLNDSRIDKKQTIKGNNLVSLAAYNAHFNVIKVLFNTNSALFKPNDFGTTPLLQAVCGKHDEDGTDKSIERIELLNWMTSSSKDNGFGDNLIWNEDRSRLFVRQKNPTLKVFQPHNNYGNCLTTQAGFFGSLDIVKWLYERYKDYTGIFWQINNDDDDVLFSAAGGGHVDIVDWLLNEDVKRISQRGNNGRTVLLQAIAFNQRPLVEKLFADFEKYKEITLSDTDVDDNGICHLAAVTGDKQMLDLLSRRVAPDIILAELSRRNKFGLTPYLIAARCGNISALQWFNEKYTLQVDSTLDEERNGALVHIAHFQPINVLTEAIEKKVIAVVDEQLIRAYINANQHNNHEIISYLHILIIQRNLESDSRLYDCIRRHSGQTVQPNDKDLSLGAINGKGLVPPLPYSCRHPSNERISIELSPSNTIQVSPRF